MSAPPSGPGAPAPSDPPPPGDPPPLDEQAFRTLAAPGLDEDDLFAALHGLQGRGALWGERGTRTFPPSRDQRGWDPVDERRRRHLDVLRRWDPTRDVSAATPGRDPAGTGRDRRPDREDPPG